MRESPQALRAALRELDERIASLAETGDARARLARNLTEAREARRVDRERAIAALGVPHRRIEICEGTAGVVRPGRCPGCGVRVVDPRGLDRAEVARRLGTDGGWLARTDGLLSALECIPITRARERRRLLTRAMLVSSLVGFALGRALTLAG